MNIKNKFNDQDDQEYQISSKYIYDKENDSFIEKRKRVLSNDDIRAICEIFKNSKKCECPIDEEDLVEAVKFYKNVNAFFDGTKKKTWDIVLTTILLGIIGAIGAGIFTKFK